MSVITEAAVECLAPLIVAGLVVVGAVGVAAVATNGFQSKPPIQAQREAPLPRSTQTQVAARVYPNCSKILRDACQQGS